MEQTMRDLNTKGTGVLDFYLGQMRWYRKLRGGLWWRDAGAGEWWWRHQEQGPDSTRIEDYR